MEQALDSDSHTEVTACRVDAETKQWVTGADHGCQGCAVVRRALLHGQRAPCDSCSWGKVKGKVT